MLSLHVKFVQTDRQMDRQTDNGKTICPPIFQYGGIKTERTCLRMFVEYRPVDCLVKGKIPSPGLHSDAPHNNNCHLNVARGN